MYVFGIKSLIFFSVGTTARNSLANNRNDFGITVGIFLRHDLAGIPLKILPELFFENLAGTPFFRGPKPPFLWEKGVPANFKIPNLLTKVFGMKTPRKYRRVHTEIPNR